MSQFNAPTYDIARPTGQCAFTGRTLQPGEHYMAALVETDLNEPSVATAAAPATSGGTTRPATAAAPAINLGFRRVDVSVEAWEQGHRPEKMFSYWRSTVQPPNVKKKVFVDDEVLLNLFRRLEGTDDAMRQAFRFVLGLILMRKRWLRYETSVKRPGAPNETGQPTEQEWWVMQPKASPQSQQADGEPLEMLNPHLDDEKVKLVTEQLGEILNAEL